MFAQYKKGQNIMKLKSFVIALAAVMLLLYCCAPLQAAKAVKLPGHISGLLKDKFSTDLIVTHPGKYLFQFQQSGNSQKGDKTAAKTNFRDYVDISIISKDGTKIAGNFFPGEQGSGYHSDFFTLNVDRSDNLKLLITPIAEKAKNMNFMIFCDHVAPQVLVMGMEWSHFLALIITTTLLLTGYLFYRFILKPMPTLNVADVHKRAEELRRARSETEPQVIAAASAAVGKFCSNCGLPREEDAEFCGECGKRFGD